MRTLSALVGALALAGSAAAQTPVGMTSAPGDSRDGEIVQRAPCFQETRYEVGEAMATDALVAERTAAARAASGDSTAVADTSGVAAEVQALFPRDTFAFLTRTVDGEPGCQRIVYLSDGLRVAGFLLRPDSAASRAPVVIYNRGGNQEFGSVTPGSLFELAAFAEHGYVVVASQYRGNGGGEGHDEFGGADVNDVLNLFPLIDALDYADPDRIGMVGWSRGGMMTYLALARTDRVRAAVVGAGLTDGERGLVERPDMEGVYAELVPGWPQNRAQALEARSAIRWVDRLDKETPILLLHGSADWRVDPTQALDMAQALYAARHPFRLVFFEGGDHGLTEYDDEVDRVAMDWLDRYVRDRAPLPDLEPHGG